MFIYAFASCSIAWFPSIVLVGFLLAEVRPPTVSTKLAMKGLEIVGPALVIGSRSLKPQGLIGCFSECYVITTGLGLCKDASRHFIV
jgi:hypothetical protein